MRAFGKFAVVLAGIALLSPAPARASLREDVAGFFHGIAVHFRMLRLAAQPPDSVLILPLRTTRVHRLYDSWGAGRPDGRKHQGQDLFAPRGTPVYSATTGYVTRIGENRLGGLTVWVMGAGRRVYYYAHLDRYPEGLKANDRVDTGTVIGYVGATGNARGGKPHLHFGVYTLQGPINPMPLLRDPGRTPSF
ncbi:MAG: family metallopeptidase [Fibrobacteria bacterium]|jgi:murein DD-endopeptidase MepM/ murein hydrolase activator NlpD|nr:family metallopeptidase [Fibrobacteria bacterium]